MNEPLLPATELLNNKRVEDCIYTIRDKQIMLDSDLAYFFGIDVKRLNEQQRRNIERFPEDFCFKLNSKEFKNYRSQNATFRCSTKGRKYPPYVYTEHGIITLAGVLKSKRAAEISVQIARSFIQMRKFIQENSDTLLTLARIQNRQLEFESETNKRFEEILKLIDSSNVPKEATFYAGQFYDAYEFIVSIIVTAKESIILLDPYCDSKAFTFLKNRNSGVSIIIVKGIHSKLSDKEIEVFESEYGPISIKTTDDIHDRYLIIDEQTCYSLGSSLNYAGKRLSSIHKIEDSKTIQTIVNNIR